MGKLLFSVTKKDFRIDFYRGTGKGGQKRNKTENCCRITHIASGAVGKSEEGRSKIHNQQVAFERCIATKEFQSWCRVECARELGITAQIEAKVDREMRSDNLLIEGKDEKGLWTKLDKVVNEDE